MTLAKTKQNLNNLLQRAIREVEQAGIKVAYKHKIDPNVRLTKATSYLGNCRYKANQDKYIISVSDLTLHNGEDDVYDTILHEVLHTLPDSMNHGKVWQSHVNRVNAFYGYKLQTKGKYSKDASKVLQSRYKYKFVCSTCGQKIHRVRQSAFTRNYETYRCGKCGGTFTQLPVE